MGAGPITQRLMLALRHIVLFKVEN